MSEPKREVAPLFQTLAEIAAHREVHPNQVRASDITYLPMAHGYLYLVAILDVISRTVLASRLSNTLTADFCVAALEEALAKFGRPEIVNPDHTSQFTGEEWTTTPKDPGVSISMIGKDRRMDNVFIERLWRAVKHEDRKSLA